jgi:hypothetical protein
MVASKWYSLFEDMKIIDEWRLLNLSRLVACLRLFKLLVISSTTDCLCIAKASYLGGEMCCYYSKLRRCGGRQTVFEERKCDSLSARNENEEVAGPGE